MKRILRILYKKTNKLKYCGILLLGLIEIIAGFELPNITQAIVDDGLIEKNINLVFKLTSLAIICTAIMSFVNIIKSKIEINLYYEIQYELRKNILKHLNIIDFSFYHGKNATEIFSTMEEDVNLICSIVNSDTLDMLSDLFLSIAWIIVLIKMNKWLFLLLVLFSVVQILCVTVLSKKNEKCRWQYLKEKQKYGKWFETIVIGTVEIRLLNLYQKTEREFDNIYTKVKKVSSKSDLFNVLNGQIQGMLEHILVFVIYIGAAILMMKNKITIGEVITFITYSSSFSLAIAAAGEMIYGLSNVRPSLDRIDKFFSYDVERTNGKDFQNGDIFFSNVDFAYDNQNNILEGFNLHIKMGDSVAITGKNGSGKTTIIKLLLGMEQPSSGSISIAGININNMNYKSYRDVLAVVNQNIYLFDDSIKNNICLYDNVDLNDYKRIIRLVKLESLIMEKGENYRIGINGENLSGGQRQKIALARVLLKKKKVMILDEVTSNLDIETKEVVYNLIYEKPKDLTVIIISHDNDISKYVDRVYKID